MKLQNLLELALYASLILVGFHIVHVLNFLLQTLVVIDVMYLFILVFLALM